MEPIVTDEPLTYWATRPSDNVMGGRLVAEYFLRHGHTRLAVVGGDSTISTGRDRRAGFLGRLGEASIKIAARMTPMADFSHAAGREAGLALLRSRNPPTAIFCVNDLLAFGVLDAAREQDIAVPLSLWVAGYDDVQMASWWAFDLTTVRQPTDEMARVVVETLLRRIADPSAPVEQRRFGAELVIRRSTGAKPVDGGSFSAVADFR